MFSITLRNKLRSIYLLAREINLCRVSSLTTEGSGVSGEIRNKDIAEEAILETLSDFQGKMKSSSEDEASKDRQSICLPTVFVPKELHNAIDVAISG